MGLLLEGNGIRVQVFCCSKASSSSSIISAYDFNVDIELSADKKKEGFKQRLGVKLATHEKHPSAPSKIICNSKKITGTRI